MADAPLSGSGRATLAALAAPGFAEDRVPAAAAANLASCARALIEGGAGAETPAYAWFVPGRIEVLGKHTDYAGGRSLLAAAERGFAAVAVARADDRLQVLDVAGGERLRVRIDERITPAAGWANYPMTVARRVARNFPGAARGADLAFVSDLPPAAGMSSSSALMIATFLVLSEVNQLGTWQVYRDNLGSAEALAGYLATVENGQSFGALEGDLGVGTQGGSEDHLAILCARAGHLVEYCFAPVRRGAEVPLPEELVFVVASSGVRAEKTGAARDAYNQVSERMRVAVELWRASTQREERTIGELLAAEPDAIVRLREVLRASRPSAFDPDELLRRVYHFQQESGVLIPAAVAALQRGDLAEFGAVVDRSQLAAEQFLLNQVPETVYLARSARDLGAVAASSFGAGFGGSVWALTSAGGAEQFTDRWRAAYGERFPDRVGASVFFHTRPGPPAVRLA